MAMLPRKHKRGIDWYKPVKEFATATAAEDYKRELRAKNPKTRYWLAPNPADGVWTVWEFHEFVPRQSN